MPHPLSRVASNASYELGNAGLRSLNKRPNLAMMAMEAIAAWSHFENFMLQVFVRLAGGSGADAAAIYLAMEAATAKAVAIDVLADRKLSEDHRRLLRAIMKVGKSAQKERDKLAHWIWGTSPDLPDVLLLADPRKLQYTRDSIYVYRASDFEALRTKFDRMSGWGLQFLFIMRQHVANGDGSLYARLCQEPEISEILNRPAKQG